MFTRKIWVLDEELTSADLNSNFANMSVDAIEVGNVSGTSWARTYEGFNTGNPQGCLVSISPSAGVAVVGFSRTSDSGIGNAGGQSAFTFGGLSVNDNVAAVQTSYCAYFEGRRSAGAGVTQGIEVGLVNFGAAVGINPYYMGGLGSTMNYWASAGRSDITGTQANLTCILGAQGGGTVQWEKGIVFGHQTIRAGSVGSEALNMAPGYAITWSNPADNGSKAYIRSDAVTTSTIGSTGLIFTETGLVVHTPDTITSFEVATGQVRTVNLQVNGNAKVTGTFEADGAVTFFQGTYVLNGLHACTSDADAASQGVPINGVYRNASQLMLRVS